MQTKRSTVKIRSKADQFFLLVQVELFSSTSENDIRWLLTHSDLSSRKQKSRFRTGRSHN